MKTKTVLLGIIILLSYMVTNAAITVHMDSVGSIQVYKAKFYATATRESTDPTFTRVGFQYAPLNALLSTDTISYFFSKTGTTIHYNYLTTSENYFLAPNTTYWIRALYVTRVNNVYDTTYSTDTLHFTTLPSTPSTSQVTNVESITKTSANIFAKIIEKGDSYKISGWGVILDTLPNPVSTSPSAIVQQFGTSGASSSSSHKFVYNLFSGVQYYVKAWVADKYAKYIVDTVYSDSTYTFRTISSCDQPPQHPDSISLGEYEAILTWEAGEGQRFFQVDYGASGHEAGMGTIVDVIDTNVVHLTGLTSNRSYTWFVRAMCADRYSDWGDEKSFRTWRAACEQISGLHVSELSYMTAKISWTSGTSDQNTWEVLLAKSSESYPVESQAFTITGTPQYFPVGLDASTEYKVKVRAKCDSMYSVWSSDLKFTTNRSGIDDVDGTKKIIIYPNPSSGVVYFRADKRYVLGVEIYSSLGTLVHSSNMLPESADLSKYGSGIFTLSIKTKDGIKTEKILIN